MIPRCVGAKTRSYAAMEGVCPPPQGALAPVRLMLSGPSSLNRPHPPHSRAHRDFTAKRLIRDAFAVRERRGDPRVVPSFHYHSFLACRPLRPRGARSSLCPVPRCRHGPSPRIDRLGAPKYPAIRFTRELVFVALRFASATACQVARPPIRIRLERPAFGDFYFQAFNGSVFLPVAGYNYNSDWTPLLAGLSPAGMAASLAARSLTTDLFRAGVDQCPLLPR